MAKLGQSDDCRKRVLTLGEKVLANAARDIQKRTGTARQRWEDAARDTVDGERARKASNRRRYEQKYNRIKTNPWPARVNLDQHVHLPKVHHLTGTGKNGRLPLRALAIYPVLASRANYTKDEARPISQQNLGELAGLSDVTAAHACTDLQHAMMGTSTALLEATLTTGRNDRSYYLYRTRFIRPHLRDQWQGEYFVFHVALIDSRVWRALRNTTKALYLGLRSAAHFDASRYAAEEGVDLTAEGDGRKTETTEFYRDFGQRRWDIYRGSLARVCRMVGISDKNPSWMLRELQRAGLVERLRDGGYKVFLRPPDRLIPDDPRSAADSQLRD